MIVIWLAQKIQTILCWAKIAPFETKLQIDPPFQKNSHLKTFYFSLSEKLTAGQLH